jgi:DNA-binding MarR family transcriptional regulator
MSNEASNRVWYHSAQRGSRLVLLLALANRADEDGIAWPGIEYLAKRSRVEEREAKNLIKSLEESGELFVERGRGRGNTSKYLVTTGHSESELTEILVRRFDYPEAKAHQNSAQIMARLKQSEEPQKVQETAPNSDGIKGASSYHKRCKSLPVKGATLPQHIGKTKDINKLNPQECVNAPAQTPENSREMFDLNGGDDPRYHTPHYLTLLEVCDLEDNTLQLDPRKRAFAAGVAVQLADVYTPEQFRIARANWPHETAPSPKQFATEIKRLLNRKEHQANATQRLPARVANDDAAAKRMATKFGNQGNRGGDAVSDARRPLPAAANGSIHGGNGRVLDGTPEQSADTVAGHPGALRQRDTNTNR